MLRDREIGMCQEPTGSTSCSISGGGSNSEGRSTAGSLSVLNSLIGGLFGTGSEVKGGALGFSKANGKDFDFNLGQLNPGDFDANEFFRGRENSSQSFDLSQGFGGLQDSLNTQQQAARDGLTEETTANFKNIFQNDILPDIQNQFGGMGLNQNDSDFGASVAREIGRGSAGIANLGADRRMQASSQFGDFLGSLGGGEQSLRNTERDRNPGAQAFSNLLGLGGIQTQGQGTGRSRSKGGQGGVQI